MLSLLSGICFGHQIIARAFGSTVERNPKGWEVGSTELHLTEAGRELFNPVDWPDRQTVRIQQAHADIVTSTPEGFELLASSDLCDVQALAQRYVGSPPEYTHACPHETRPYSSVHVLTMQGHPECVS